MLKSRFFAFWTDELHLS